MPSSARKIRGTTDERSGAAQFLLGELRGFLQNLPPPEEGGSPQDCRMRGLQHSRRSNTPREITSLYGILSPCENAKARKPA